MKPKDFARQLRRNMTDAERLLWKHLRAHRLIGHKFRRQHPIGPYVADFVHLGAKLIIEADGRQHNENPRDAARDAWLQTRGYRILRFWNHEILNKTEAVLAAILNALEETSPYNIPGRYHCDPPSPSGRGAGERT